MSQSLVTAYATVILVIIIINNCYFTAITITSNNCCMTILYLELEPSDDQSHLGFHVLGFGSLSLHVFSAVLGC